MDQTPGPGAGPGAEPVVAEAGPVDWVEITADPISQLRVTQFVTESAAGAISVFLGITRDHFQGKKVVRLEYEAYSAMAAEQLRKVCSDVRQKWPVLKMAIVHRIGVVPVSEVSIAVAASAEHRAAAIAAVAFAVDAVKATATIWKKEVYADGGAEWKENKECAWRR